jgi:hypothetical protein
MMNERLQSIARTEMFNDLLQCTGKQRRFFAIMHLGVVKDSIPNDVKEDISDEDLKYIIQQILPEHLSWAMEQTRKTVLKNQGVI